MSSRPSGPSLRAAAAAAALLLAVLPAARPQEPSPPEVPFLAKLDVVVVDAVVLGRGGDPVEGLTARDFVVREDGVPQEITQFQAVTLAESPPSALPSASRVASNAGAGPDRPARSFVIVFDDVHLAPERVGLAKAAVEEFLRTGLAPGDQVTLIPTSGGAWWSAPAGAGLEDLVAAMHRLEGRRPRNRSIDRISDWEAIRLHLHRDKRVGAEVARRYYEHRIILEPAWQDRETARELTDIGEGHPLIRIKAAETYHAARTRQEATLGVLERAAEALASTRGRKSLLLVSEGFVHEPSMDRFRLVVDAARRANVAVYFLDARGLDGLPAHAGAEIPEPTDSRDLGYSLDESVREAEGAVSIAADTGGFSIKNRNDLADAMRRISRESRSYYLLGYQPSRPRADGRYRKLEVETSRPGATVRARRGYYAPDPSGKRRRQDGDALDPLLRVAIDSPFDGAGVPLRLTSLVLGPAGGGKTNVVLAAEADPAALALERGGGRFEGALETFVLVSSRDTGESFHDERLLELSLPPEVKQALEATWLPFQREFQLAPGVYQARLLARDRRSGRVGTVRHSFEVPAASFRTSTPILTDRVMPAPDGGRAPSRPVPVARRTFASGQQLYYAFEVFGAAPGPGSGAPRVEAAYLVRDAQGSILTQAAARPIPPGPAGQLAQMLAFSLQQARPGSYEVVLTVRDLVAGAQLVVRDPFEVAAAGSAVLGTAAPPVSGARPRPGPRGPS